MEAHNHLVFQTRRPASTFLSGVEVSFDGWLCGRIFEVKLPLHGNLSAALTTCSPISFHDIEKYNSREKQRGTWSLWFRSEGRVGMDYSIGSFPKRTFSSIQPKQVSVALGHRRKEDKARTLIAILKLYSRSTSLPSQQNACFCALLLRLAKSRLKEVPCTMPARRSDKSYPRKTGVSLN